MGPRLNLAFCASPNLLLNLAAVRKTSIGLSFFSQKGFIEANTSQRKTRFWEMQSEPSAAAPADGEGSKSTILEMTGPFIHCILEKKDRLICKNLHRPQIQGTGDTDVGAVLQ